MGESGPARAAGGGRPFDRLRANGIAVWACDGVWGNRGCNDGQGAPPGVRSPFDFPQGERTPPHLCVHVCAGMTRVRGPSTGSGRTELRGARATGSGVAMGDGDAPRRAPLDSCLRRNDAWCGAAGQSAVVCCEAAPALHRARPEGPAAPRSPFDFPQGERPPLPNVGTKRMALSRWVPACAGMTRRGGVWEGRGTREPRPAPRPWVPAFAGTTVGGVRAGGGCWWRRGESPAAAGRALREAPLRRGVGRGCGGVWWWGALRQAQGERNRGARGRRGVGRGRRRCGEGYASGRGIQRALKSWG